MLFEYPGQALQTFAAKFTGDAFIDNLAVNQLRQLPGITLMILCARAVGQAVAECHDDRVT